MHESVLGVALGLIAVGVLVAIFTPVTRALEGRFVRRALGLPRDTPLVRVDGVLVPRGQHR